MIRALLLAALACAPVRAQMTASGDLTITGATGVGTDVPRAALEVAASTADAYALKVSSPNGTTLFLVTTGGRAGVGVTPTALWDVKGQGDASDIGLQLRSGNSSSTYSSSQIVFADASGAYRHSLRTRGVGTQALGNSLDFFLWRSTGQLEALGDLRALSLQAVSASSAAVHVRPSTGTPAYDLVVSDGYTLGAGSVLAAAVGNHSRRELKEGIVYLDESAERRAYDETRALRHARFRYKGRGGVTRGLIYEDAPESIRSAPGQSIVLEARLANLEMALKEANRQISIVEEKIASMEKAR